MVRDAYITASAAGGITVAEVAVVKQLLQASGIPAERFEAVDAWARESVAHLQRGFVLLQPEGSEDQVIR